MIASWVYPAPFDLYNMHGPGVDLIDPGLNYHVCRADGQVAAFLCCAADAQVPGYVYDKQRIDVGWGLAPNLVGRGLGAKLIHSVLRFVGAGTGYSRFRATVAQFNKRCRRACKSAGFQHVATFKSSFSGRGFVVMHTEFAACRNHRLGRPAHRKP